MKLSSLFNGQPPASILFDLDGTLVDSAPDLTAAVDTMLATLGREPAGEAQVRDWVGNGAGILVKRALAGQFDYQTNPGFSDDDYRKALDLFFTAYSDTNGRQAKVYPGVVPFLQAVHALGIPMGVVTNKPQAFTGPLLQKMQLDPWFEIAISGDTLPVKKPDPAPLLHALNILGGAPERCLMVGDSVNDIEAAKRAGMPSVAVSYGYNYGSDVSALGADIVVDSLAELL
ncbi:phosphoglycolate phosphatase [Marinobacter sp. 1Y8]